MLQVRAMRAEINGLLQTCKSVDEVKTHGAAFGEKYGDSVWGCTTIYTTETFADLYNAHLQRCLDEAESREKDEERKAGIRIEISNCGNLQTFDDIKAFVERCCDDAQINWELAEKGQELMHPDYLDGGLP